MPQALTYPGVYIEEVPSGVRTISGVATSIAAFIGYTARGPVDTPVQIFSFADFEREFGGLDMLSPLSYSVSHFFLNGGGTAWIVRVAPGAVKASVGLLDKASGTGVALALTASAISEGVWGNNLRIAIDYDTTDPATLFNLTVSEVQAGTQQVVRSEVHRNLSMAPLSNNFAVDSVNAASNLIRLAAGAALAGRPVQTGTAWTGYTPPVDFANPATTASLKVKLVLPPAAAPSGFITKTLWSAGDSPPQNMEQLRATVQAALNGIPGTEFSSARVLLAGDRLIAIPGGNNAAAHFIFSDGPEFGPTAGTVVDLSDSSVANVAAYRLGAGATTDILAQDGLAAGVDGTPPTAVQLEGSQLAKTGLYALEDVDLFNILLLPDQSDPTLQAKAIAYAEKRRAFVLLDLPDTVDSLPEAKAWLVANGGLRLKNAAAYFPRVQLADPMKDNRLRSFANSGAVAGLYARTDNERGVWKAPAGTAAKLIGVQAPDYILTDAENGVINPLGLNAIRSFPAYGNVAWGARTMEGADAQASEWKYIPIRRLALFLEESLYRGTQWVVFEPNDEPLWAQIRLNIGAFLNGLFRQGAFQGMTPKEAYFVKCDRDTTTQADINNGIVNIMVGFAPLKPAEFVVIKIQQMAGDIPT
jgi:hypothetical protein